MTDLSWELVPAGDRALRATATRGGRPVSFDAFLEGLAQDRAVRASFTALLRTVPQAAFCWETPPLLPPTLAGAFECAFVESPALARFEADPSPFREHFTAAPAVRFESLGRDALLVAPCPRGPADAYAHLAVFVRGAPEAQIDALWAEVGDAARARLGPHPVWLSTAGLGVSWLHVRLDSRPKYYRTKAYAYPGWAERDRE